ncbi:hypothetical protein LBMAG10_02970 [Actinomycetes bacterium]|nr:hypothetical protein LBMAG10_02970 [Actinomycetes bacterium]
MRKSATRLPLENNWLKLLNPEKFTSVLKLDQSVNEYTKFKIVGMMKKIIKKKKAGTINQTG